MKLSDANPRVTRRSVLAGTGALVLVFSLQPAFAQEPAVSPPPSGAEPPSPPGSLEDTPLLDAWIRIDPDNKITVFTGKVEFGQGIKTALRQVAAEELKVRPEEIELVTADTARTPDEGFTAGSQSMQNSGTAIRHASAQVREILIAEAAGRLNLSAEQLRAEGGHIIAPDLDPIPYGELVTDQLLHVKAGAESKLTDPSEYQVIGHEFQRVDIPAKVTGEPAYVHDLRLEGMVHARVVRPPSPNANLAEVDPSSVESLPGVISVIRDGNFLAVVAEKEFQAIVAMRRLAELARWEEEPNLPDQAQLPEVLQSLEREIGTVAEEGSPNFSGDVYEATFFRPYQMHASMGPSCAVGVANDEGVTVWTHTQGSYPDREAIAEMLGLPLEQVRVIHMEGAGCYGHNGADDAAADAALIATAVPGRPVRVQWMREQEHGWEPYGPAMLTKVRATLDENGRISNWAYDLWSNVHSTRPGGAASLLAARHRANSVTPPPPRLNISQAGNGDRNANPPYVIPNKRVLWHFLPDMPLRVSALRALGAYANVFAIESFMDELAFAAGVDPVEFRLQHLEDQRARDVVELAAERFGWSPETLPKGRGRGFGYARYKTLAAYCAVAAEVEVNPETGRSRVVRAVAAIDSGEAVNPDGIRNQTQGGVVQSASWTLYEAVTFDDTRITSIDWSSYPIMRFRDVPESVEVHVIDRPGEPYLGTGEAAQGPAAAAVANALANAIGQRLYEIPFTRERVREAIARAG